MGTQKTNMTTNNSYPQAYPPSAIDNRPLPAGWAQQWSQQYNRFFFHNLQTGQSLWDDPRGPFSNSSIPQSYGTNSQTAMQSGPPPPPYSQSPIPYTAYSAYPQNSSSQIYPSNPNVQSQYSYPPIPGPQPQQYVQPSRPQQTSVLGTGMLGSGLGAGLLGGAGGLLGGVLLGEALSGGLRHHHHHPHPIGPPPMMGPFGGFGGPGFGGPLGGFGGPGFGHHHHHHHHRHH